MNSCNDNNDNKVTTIRALLSEEEVIKLIESARAEALKNVRSGLVKHFEQEIWNLIDGQVEKDFSYPVEHDVDIKKQKNGHLENLVYVYCITSIEASKQINFNKLESMGEDGCVRGVECGDLFIVYCYVSSETFGEKVLESNMQDMKWLEKMVVFHQSVIESIMEQFPVIPMKFCTIFISVERAVEIVRDKYKSFMSAVEEIKGCEEWGVKIYYDPTAFQKYLKDSGSCKHGINRKDGRENGSGAAYLINKKIDETIAGEAEAEAFNYAQSCHAELLKYAEKWAVNKLLSRDVTGRFEEMVLNSAYLVPVARVESFKEQVSVLERKYAEYGMILDLTGPWPPYNFVGIEGGAESNV